MIRRFPTYETPAVKFAPQKQHEPGCACLVCLGLECLERPRYYSGQLLTEAELTSAQDYVLAKSRLHNRYLHGWGVVCGLEVACHECAGWVTVRPGYAIDPCGNDIVVCGEHDFDLLKAIRDCRGSRPIPDCDPIRPGNEKGCEDVEETWCLTLTYEEKEARPMATLRRDRCPTCNCGSGSKSNGNGKGCSCGCHGQSSAKSCSTRSNAQAQHGVGQTTAACEPTRIYESYRLGVCEGPCGDLRSELENTLLGRIFNCLSPMIGFITKRVPMKTLSRDMVFAYGLDGPPTDSRQKLYEECCRLQQAVRDLYAKNPANVRCTVFDTLNQIECPSPNLDIGFENYSAQIRQSMQHSYALLLQYVLDCACQSLLPPCSPDPCDDRLILACITVKGDKIIRICNFSCRHFAGSFPALNYWMSIGPLLRRGLEIFCCLPDLVRANSPLVNDLTSFLDSVDPDGGLRQAIFAGDYALPRHYADALGKVLGNLSLPGLSNLIRTNDINLPTMVGRPPAQAKAMLDEAGVRAIEREVESADEVSGLKTLAQSPFAKRGDAVVVYHSGGKVVGYAPFDPATELIAKETELKSLREEFAAMRAEMAALKSSDRPAAPASRRAKPPSPKSK